MNLPPQTQVVDRSDAKVINMVRELRVWISKRGCRDFFCQSEFTIRSCSSLEAFSESGFFFHS